MNNNSPHATRTIARLRIVRGGRFVTLKCAPADDAVALRRLRWQEAQYAHLGYLTKIDERARR